MFFLMRIPRCMQFQQSRKTFNLFLNLSLATGYGVRAVTASGRVAARRRPQLSRADGGVWRTAPLSASHAAVKRTDRVFAAAKDLLCQTLIPSYQVIAGSYS
jgi:hypothetical protein